MWAVVAGQIRDPQNATHLLSVLLGSIPPDRIILSTWDDEGDERSIDRFLSAGATLVRSPPVAADSWGNVRRQSTLLLAGLDHVPSGSRVYKVRPDWYLDAATVNAVAATLEDLPKAGPGSRLGQKILVPWFNPQVPFRVGDESFAGMADDLRILGAVDPVLSAGCPHVARFVTVADLSPRLRMFVDGPATWVSEAQLALRPALCDALGLRRRAVVRRVRPTMYGFFRRLAQCPAQQPVLADWLYVMRQSLSVLNTDPTRDQYLSRLGSPWTSHGYTDSLECSDPLRDRRFTISYDSSESAMTRLAASSTTAAARLKRLDESEGAALADPLSPSEVAAYRAACYKVFISTMLGDGSQGVSNWLQRRKGLRNGVPA